MYISLLWTTDGCIFGEQFRRRAEVVTIDGFSIHGSQPFLMEYALASRDNLKRTYLVHGEPRGVEPLMDKMKVAGLRRITFPALHQEVEIGAGSK